MQVRTVRVLHHYRRGSRFNRRKCHRYRHHHHQQHRTIQTSIIACCHASQSASFLRRKIRRRRLVAISLTLVPIATTDSLTTSALAKPQSAAPADRLDEKYATPYDKPNLLEICGSRQSPRVLHRTNHSSRTISIRWGTRKRGAISLNQLFFVQIENYMLVAANF
jgi:hypothetical protein